MRKVVSVAKVKGHETLFAVALSCGHATRYFLEKGSEEKPPEFLACSRCKALPRKPPKV